QVLTIKYATSPIRHSHRADHHRDDIGTPSVKCTTAAITPAPAGIGMPTKYFFPGLPGLVGCGLLVILNLARRLAPAIINRKLAIAPSWTILAMIVSSEKNRSIRKPHIQPSSAGATPNVITSASESSSRPKSLAVPVIRAIRPSKPSNSTANPIALAALSKCQGSTAVACVT